MIEFGRLTEMIENIMALDEDQVLFRAFSDGNIQQEVIDLNTIEQLYGQGVDSKGVRIGAYSPHTIVYKIATGQRWDHITLNDEGDFYKSWEVKPYLGGLFLNADDFKPFNPNSRYNRFFGNTIGRDVYLFNEYGIDILGLTDQSKEELNPILNDVINSIVLDEILR